MAGRWWCPGRARPAAGGLLQPAPGGPAPDPAELRLRWLAAARAGGAGWRCLKRLTLTPTASWTPRALPTPGGGAGRLRCRPPCRRGGPGRGAADPAGDLGRGPGTDARRGGELLRRRGAQPAPGPGPGPHRGPPGPPGGHGGPLPPRLPGRPGPRPGGGAPCRPRRPRRPRGARLLPEGGAPSRWRWWGWPARLPGEPDLDAFAGPAEGRELITRLRPAAHLAAGEDPARLADPPTCGRRFMEGIDRIDAAILA